MSTVDRVEGAPSAAPGLVGIEATVGLARALLANLESVLLGTAEAVLTASVAALSGGHLLIEDVPGVGKTVLAKALARSLGAQLSRVQGHPDLLTSDVTGVSVFLAESGTWEFRHGPLFAQVVLVDELNRTPPRTQSALLEAMEEQQVTVDGSSWPLPQPHMVIATQNPLSQLGTYPLVESQLDRFALATAVGYPDASTEARLVTHHGGKFALDDLAPVCDVDGWASAQVVTQNLNVAPAVAQYAVDLCRATRTAPGVRLGASPRAAIWLIRCAQAHALVKGRHYVAPDDVKAMARPCLAHRLIADSGDDGRNGVVQGVLESVAAPRL